MSLYLIPSVEILADAICHKKDIRSITLHDKEIKLSQYADDSTLVLDGSEHSFLEALKTIELFGNISGLKLNNSKTEAPWTGANAESDLKLCPEIKGLPDGWEKYIFSFNKDFAIVAL